MSEMIGRVARAIFDGQWRANSWESTSEAFRADCRNMARAAIASMREPTPTMRINGGIAWSDAEPEAITYVDNADACYKAMIDAALNDH